MKVLISGSHGFIGTALVARLEELGHSVTRLVRKRAKEGEILWNAETGDVDVDQLEGFDAVIHLGGVGIGEKRWSVAEKERIWDSRINSTELLVSRLTEVVDRPKVFVCASGIGYYGTRVDETLTEASSMGEGFLAQVVDNWEDATSKAAEAGIRVVNVRSGIVLGAGGGALAKQLPLFRACLGGRLGEGKQYMAWISLRDEVNGIIHALTAERLSGPVNFSAPNPCTNLEFTKSLGAAVGRPTFIPAWPWLLSIAFGAQLRDEMLLASQRAVPRKLLSSGFTFQDETINEAFAGVIEQIDAAAAAKKAEKEVKSNPEDTSDK